MMVLDLMASSEKIYNYISKWYHMCRCWYMQLTEGNGVPRGPTPMSGKVNDQNDLKATARKRVSSFRPSGKNIHNFTVSNLPLFSNLDNH